jgi:enoyl-CoA hydratase/carnithine racemase
VPYPDVLNAIMDSPKPVIAAINGAAFAGGLGLVGAADIVITKEDVQFSFSEVRIGVIPAVISVVCLPKLGTHHGMKLFLTGERFSGKQAVEMGFAHRAVHEDELEEAVNEEIDMINLGGPIAVQECKKNWFDGCLNYQLLRGLRRQLRGAPECLDLKKGLREWLRSEKNERQNGLIKIRLATRG